MHGSAQCPPMWNGINIDHVTLPTAIRLLHARTDLLNPLPRRLLNVDSCTNHLQLNIDLNIATITVKYVHVLDPIWAIILIRVRLFFESMTHMFVGGQKVIREK